MEHLCNWYYLPHGPKFEEKQVQSSLSDHPRRHTGHPKTLYTENMCKLIFRELVQYRRFSAERDYVP
jgi:hypothetical protein